MYFGQLNGSGDRDPRNQTLNLLISQGKHDEALVYVNELRKKDLLDTYEKKLMYKLFKNLMNMKPLFDARKINECQQLCGKCLKLSYDLMDINENYDKNLIEWLIMLKSFCVLSKGDYQEGFKLYEHRPIMTEEVYHLDNHRRWNGASNLAGKRIMVMWEQGFGDEIQFIRYLPALKQKGAYVIYCTRKELLSLFKQMSCIDEVVTKPVTNYDAWVPLLSLPTIFNTTLKTIPKTVPYINVNNIGGISRNSVINSKFNVGIVWRSSAVNFYGIERNCSFRYLEPLFSLEKVQFYSLQIDDSPASGSNVIDLAGSIQDFADTAAIIHQLDLVVTVDTSVAHLAGAMGKPTWTLLPYVADWRWLLKRSDTPWYPSMRLFRQQKPGDWCSVIKSVKQELIQLLRERPICLRRA